MAHDEHGRPPTTDEHVAVLQAANSALVATTRDLHEWLDAQATPARHYPVLLTAAQPVLQLEAGATFRSIGVYHGNPYNVLLGVDGAPASTQSRAFAIPAGLVVLPLNNTMVEVAASVADINASGDAVVHVLRFEAVQPAFFGGWL